MPRARSGQTYLRQGSLCSGGCMRMTGIGPRVSRSSRVFSLLSSELPALAGYLTVAKFILFHCHNVP